MSIETIKAIQLSHMEEELKEIESNIRKITYFLNKPNFSSAKEFNNKKLLRLIARKKVLEEKITESFLLDQ